MRKQNSTLSTYKTELKMSDSVRFHQMHLIGTGHLDKARPWPQSGPDPDADYTDDDEDYGAGESEPVDDSDPYEDEILEDSEESEEGSEEDL